MNLLQLVFACVAAFPAWYLINGLRTGRVQAKGGSYGRSEDPGWFWTMIVLYAAFIALVAYLMVGIAAS
jgi:hypothetical protein